MKFNLKIQLLNEKFFTPKLSDKLHLLFVNYNLKKHIPPRQYRKASYDFSCHCICRKKQIPRGTPEKKRIIHLLTILGKNRPAESSCNYQMP